MAGMDALREAVEAAFTNYRKGLIQLIVRELTAISIKNPQSKFGYRAGMGIWYFFRDQDDDFEPQGNAYEAIQDADSNYNGAATPDGDLEIQAGKILKNDLS